MNKKLCVRTVMDSKQAKGVETLHKSARQSFCHTFGSLWKEIGSKTSVLVVSETLRLFVNIVTSIVSQ